jgi:RNA polymerase sigma-70 factor (ECF subfamily)
MAAADDDARRLVDRLFRTESGRLVAHFTRRLGPSQIDLAEEVVQDALVKALQHWPYRGVPRNPSGWLYRVAANEAFDRLRRQTAFDARAAELARTLDAAAAGRVPPVEPSPIADDELWMMLLCCHPALSPDARVALALKTVGGFSVGEIARALLSTERAVAQRLVRAKRVLRRSALLPAETPRRAWTARVDSVLDVIYLLFNEGYGAWAGDNLVRADLSGEALRLGRIVAGAPDVATPRAHALVALMALHAAREPARVNARGELVTLDEQDRTRWDASLLVLGFRSLERAMAGADETAFHLQAAIAATHAAAPTAADTDWRTILTLYDALARIDPSPVVRLNRAVAVARVHGPDEGLAAIARLAREPALRLYHLLPAVEAELLAESGRPRAARRAYRRALQRQCTNPERRHLASRLRRLSRSA